MTLKIDKAGRVVLPKPIRDRLGLHAGSDLEVEETPDGVTLKPSARQPSMIKKQGLWVHTGKVPAGFDIAQAIRDDREERIRKLAGACSGDMYAAVPMIIPATVTVGECSGCQRIVAASIHIHLICPLRPVLSTVIDAGNLHDLLALLDPVHRDIGEGCEQVHDAPEPVPAAHAPETSRGAAQPS
jgi:AbrB family looped-hinge helix DNA binding protein